MGAALNYQLEMSYEICCNCGVTFALPASMGRQLRGSGQSFFCPNGHRQHYTETYKMRLEKIQKELEWAQQSRDSALKRANELADSLKATKGVVTRMKNRVSAGVCPCCNRSFENLRRHMATKHKDFKESIA